jgi:hypothetical protein
VGSRGGAGQVVAGGDVPRWWRDDGAEEAVFQPETEVRGRLLVRRSRGGEMGAGGGGEKSAGGRRLCFKGGGGEGGPERLMPRVVGRPGAWLRPAGGAPLFWQWCTDAANTRAPDGGGRGSEERARVGRPGETQSGTCPG